MVERMFAGRGCQAPGIVKWVSCVRELQKVKQVSCESELDELHRRSA